MSSLYLSISHPSSKKEYFSILSILFCSYPPSFALSSVPRFSFVLFSFLLSLFFLPSPIPSVLFLCFLPLYFLLPFSFFFYFFLLPPSFPQVRQKWCAWWVAATPDVRRGNITSTHSLLHLTHSYLYENLIHHRATCCCYNNLPRLTVYPRRFSIPLTHPPRLCVKRNAWICEAKWGGGGIG